MALVKAEIKNWATEVRTPGLQEEGLKATMCGELVAQRAAGSNAAGRSTPGNNAPSGEDSRGRTGQLSCEPGRGGELHHQNKKYSLIILRQKSFSFTFTVTPVNIGV